MNIRITTESEAMDTVRQLAYTNLGHFHRDMDAIYEMGEVDVDTILNGYLWVDIEAEYPFIDEDTEELLVCAICDFYTDMLEEMMGCQVDGQ